MSGSLRSLTIANKTFHSRLFTGTGKFSSSGLMRDALLASGSELVTVALKRVDMNNADDDILSHLRDDQFSLLPNTSGVRNAKEAVFAAQLAREALETNWIKLEIHPDPKYLMPDPVETLKAAEELVKLGFVVLPYIHADPACARVISSRSSLRRAKYQLWLMPGSGRLRMQPKRWKWAPTLFW
jgi:thiazole synthase